MNAARVQCPRCGQAWLLEVRLVHLERDAVLCPECDALWLGVDEIAPGSFRDYGTYMVEQGRDTPEDRGEIVIRGPVLTPHKPQR